jgi:CheY-like chemotaxis protein
MAKSRVVLVTNDDWVSNLIGAILGDAGLSVDVVPLASEALERVRTTQVDAVICDAILRDQDGSWLVEEIRKGPRGITPFLLLAHAEDSFSRAEALRAGADVCLVKPFRADELCLQTLAIIAMARRCLQASEQSLGALSPTPAQVQMGVRAQRSPKSLRPPASVGPSSAAFEGDVAQMSLATVLSMLELERRTGVLTVHGETQTATFAMAAGSAAQATLGGSDISPIAVLRQILRWKTGRFGFRPADESSLQAVDQHSIGALLIEAARLDDEMSNRRPDSTRPSLLPRRTETLRPAPLAVDMVEDIDEIDENWEAHEAPTRKTGSDGGPSSRRPVSRSMRPPAPDAPRSRRPPAPEDTSTRKTRPAPPPAVKRESVSVNDSGVRPRPSVAPPPRPASASAPGTGGPPASPPRPPRPPPKR